MNVECGDLHIEPSDVNHCRNYIFLLLLFIYLKERERESLIHRFTLQMSTMVETGQNKTPEPDTDSRSPIWVAEPSPVGFQGCQNRAVNLRGNCALHSDTAICRHSNQRANYNTENMPGICQFSECSICLYISYSAQISITDVLGKTLAKRQGSTRSKCCHNYFFVEGCLSYLITFQKLHLHILSPWSQRFNNVNLKELQTVILQKCRGEIEKEKCRSMAYRRSIQPFPRILSCSTSLIPWQSKV